ncbi:MAG: outer membrane beta-barrel protein, partial [Bacteroidales bacterium]|nr:outer membrane beta-barrel protein [Bacteroidales bacterium]
VFIESGLGIAMSKDNGDYNVEYQEAIFKGAYEDVYEVTFETIDGIVIPTYHTKSVNVYDTIDKVTVEEVKNTYVYLNIPLNVGYAVKLGDKFDLYAKTGLNAGIKVYEDIPTPTISGENVNIKRLTPLYHTRTDWNLQAQINIGLDYHITNKFLFGIEPNARYYIKSLVENNDAGNPYGFGVKLGFKYILK